MPEICLQGAGIVPPVRESIAACVPKHVRVGLEGQFGLDPGALDDAGEPSGAEGCSPLRREHEGRPGLLVALEAPQSP